MAQQVISVVVWYDYLSMSVVSKKVQTMTTIGSTQYILFMENWNVKMQDKKMHQIISLLRPAPHIHTPIHTHTQNTRGYVN